MAKQIMFGENARRKILTGIQTLNDAVKVTMGPTGKVVVIEKSFGAPTVTKDGVTVAKEVELKDPFEQPGIVQGSQQAGPVGVDRHQQQRTTDARTPIHGSRRREHAPRINDFNRSRIGLARSPW